MRTSRENCQAEICMFMSLLLLVFAAAWNHSVFAAICCHSMVLAAVVYGDLMFATICGLVPLPFAPCFLLFAAVLYYLLVFAGVSCSLLLFTAIYCCLLLFATTCCFLHNFSIFVAYLLHQVAICLVFADLACCYCC